MTAVTPGTPEHADDLRAFERLAGPAAVLTGLVNLLYAVSFVILCGSRPTSRRP